MVALALAAAILALWPPSSHAQAAARLDGSPAKPPDLELVGHLGGVAGEVLVDGSRVYLISGSELTILDVSDPANPRRVGYALPWGWPKSLAMVGGYLYVSGYWRDATYFGGVLIFDVSNAASPVRVGAYTLPGVGAGLTLSGNYLYALWGSDAGNCTLSGGMKILDVTDPAAPVEVGSVGGEGHTPKKQMVIQGQYGYLIDDLSTCNGGSNLAVYDLTDPTQPQHVGGSQNGGGEDIAISGNHLYVAETSGLAIWDLSDPAAPVPVGGVGNSDIWRGKSVSVQGRYAYLTSESFWLLSEFHEGGLLVIDVISPPHPVQVGYYPIEFGATGVDATGSTAYVAGKHDGLFVVNASDPANPQALGAYRAPGAVWDLAVDGHEAYTVMDSTPPASLLAVNASNRALPVVDGLFDPASSFMAVNSRWVHAKPDEIANHLWQSQRRALTDPERRYATARGDLVTWNDQTPRPLAAQGGYVYVQQRPNLAVVDARNPMSMTQVAEIPVDVWDAVVAGSYLYLPSGGLQVYDVSDPANPTLAGSCACGGGTHIGLWQQYAYLLSSLDLYVVDVSDPTHPVEAGQVALSAAHIERSVAVIQGYAFLATIDAGILVVDATDPAHPVEIEPVPVYEGIYEVAAGGDYLFAAGYSGRLIVVDASDPAHAFEAISYDLPYNTSAVSTQSGYVYLAGVDDGLYIFRYNPLIHQYYFPFVAQQSPQ